MSSHAPFEIPPITALIADTHAHLDMLEDPGEALARAARAGVALVVTVADPTEDAERTFKELETWRERAAALLAETGLPGATSSGSAGPGAGSIATPEPPDVRVIVGAHPHNAKDFDAAARERLLELVRRPLAAGIGEIGLDYHYDHSPRDVQRVVFAEQLEAARSLDVLVAVHLREAHADGLAVLREGGLPTVGCVLHCFTGDADLLEPFLELGCYVSFAGPVTFKNADSIREAARNVPLDRLLVETDCPFMTPEPYRGRPNEPALTVFTARRIAEVLGISDEDLARATWSNSLRLFAAADRSTGSA